MISTVAKNIIFIRIEIGILYLWLRNGRNIINFDANNAINKLCWWHSSMRRLAIHILIDGEFCIFNTTSFLWLIDQHDDTILVILLT